MPGQSWLLSEAASPPTLLLLCLCHILHCASKAVMHPYWTGLGINSLKNNSANKEALSHCAGAFFSRPVNQVRDLIPLKNNYRCSTGTLPRACSLQSCKFSKRSSSTSARASGGYVICNATQRLFELCLNDYPLVPEERQFTKVSFVWFWGGGQGVKSIRSQGQYLTFLRNSKLLHKRQEQSKMLLLPRNELITSFSALQMNHCPSEIRFTHTSMHRQFGCGCECSQASIDLKAARKH